MPERSTSPDLIELTHRAYSSLNGRGLEAFVGLVDRSRVYDPSRFDLGT
jgi:hypothetical protein